MKIGIFGGTFNPIHIGHLKMIKSVKENLNLDQVYFVPSYKTPDKMFEIEKIYPKHRYKMVKKALRAEKISWLKISNFEYKQKEISYTYKTILYFKNKNQSNELYWIMGEDRYLNFEKWKNYKIIQNNAKIVVYRRSSIINEKLANDKNIIYLNNKFFDFSSTRILNEIRWDFIPKIVKKYIAKNKLYLKTIVFNVLREKRYEHSVAVASHSKRLANKYKYKNEVKIFLVGLVHDLFKLHSNEFLTNYIKNNEELVKSNIPEPALHGFVVALWLKNEYLWKDKKVYNALCSHTLAEQKPSKLSKILYVADKISTDRKGEKIGKLRKLAYNNLDETYKKILKMSVKKLTKRNIDIHKFTIEAYRNLVDPNFKKNKYEYNLKEIRK